MERQQAASAREYSEHTPCSVVSTHYLIVLCALLGLMAVVRSAEAMTPREILEIVDIGLPLLSPDGRYVAFRTEQASVERNTYDTVWYVQVVASTLPPRRISEGGTLLRDSAGLPLPVSAVWSPDGKWIYYRALVDGKIDVWRAASDGSGAQPLTLDPADVRDFSLSDDGSVLHYSLGAERDAVLGAETMELGRGVRIDRNVPIGQSVFRSGLVEGRLATQRLGSWYNRVPLLSEVSDRWRALDLATRTSRDITASEARPASLQPSDPDEGQAGHWRTAHDLRTGRIGALIRVEDEDGLRYRPHVELVVLDGARDPAPIRCLSELCSGRMISTIQWRPGTDELLFTVADYQRGDAQSIFRWNVATGAVHPVVLSSGVIAGGGRWETGACGVSATTLVCVASEADRPPRLERIEIDTGDRQVLFDPNRAISVESVPSRLLRWRDRDGREFTGHYLEARRNDDSKSPLFVTYYKCAGFLRGGSGDEWPLASLAANGISALCINALPYRLDAVERYDAGRSAVETAVELLASEGAIDPRKVGMGGFSFGAETTLWTLMNSDVIVAASVATPVISKQYHLLGSNRGDVFAEGLRRYWQLGAPDETPEQWQRLAPSLNLDRIDAPILMQLPEQEFLQALDYAIPLMLDARSDVYVFPHAPHIKFEPHHKLAAYERNLDWFRFWLQGVEDSDRRKTEQYAHWRVMRNRSCEKPGVAVEGAPWYCQRNLGSH